MVNESEAWYLLGKDYTSQERRGTKARKNKEVTKQVRQRAKRELERIIKEEVYTAESGKR